MWLTIIIGVPFFFALWFIITNKSKNSNWNWLIAPIFLTMIIPLILVITSNPPIEDFPKSAKVLLNGNTEYSTINFFNYVQDGNKIIINQYCIRNSHWTDFKGYDIVNKKLTITLTDNDNNFIYTDRKSGIEYNSNNIAIQ